MEEFKQSPKIRNTDFLIVVSCNIIANVASAYQGYH